MKHYRGHLGNIQDVAVNSSGKLLCTLSNDKSLKVFDVVNFGMFSVTCNPQWSFHFEAIFCVINTGFFLADMINMMKLSYVPGCCEWVHSPGDPVSVLAV